MLNYAKARVILMSEFYCVNHGTKVNQQIVKTGKELRAVLMIKAEATFEISLHFMPGGKSICLKKKIKLDKKMRQP